MIIALACVRVRFVLYNFFFVGQQFLLAKCIWAMTVANDNGQCKFVDFVRGVIKLTANINKFIHIHFVVVVVICAVFLRPQQLPYRSVDSALCIVVSFSLFFFPSPSRINTKYK